MAWADVANKIKFYGREDGGLDGRPDQVNGLSPYGGSFSSLTEKNDILAALNDLYEHSFTARALLNTGTSTSADIWLMKSAVGSRATVGSLTASILLRPHGSPGDAKHRPVTREDALLTMRV